MKKLLLCLALLGSFSTPLFAQETSDNKAADRAARAEEKAAARAAAKAEKKAAKDAEYNMDVQYQPHSTGISYRMGGVGPIGNQTFSFDFYTRQRKGKSQYTPMVSLRFSEPFSKDTVGYLGGLGYWGFLFGGSQYVFDIRSKETGIGWSMLVNGGMTLEFPTTASVNSISEIARHVFILGGEIDFKAIYNFHKYVGATAGFTMGYALSPNFYDYKASSPLDHGFVWGFNLGFIF